MWNFIQENQYIGKQIFIDSDRLIFNGRDDTIFSTTNGFLFKTEGEFHVNTAKNTYINTPQIFLGPVQNNQDPNIPATNTIELEQLLYDLISALKVWFATAYPNTSGLNGPNIPINQGLAKSIVDILAILEKKVDPAVNNSPIRSKYVFIR